jgi:GNAT superfamily N-acetyltransferase
MDYTHDNFTISTDKTRLDIDAVYGYLSTCYWSANIPRATVEKAIQNSLCFGVYDNQQNKQAGFARLITDYATFAYLADVFILEPYRGQGLSKWMMQCIREYPDLQGLRRWALVTKDAHGLYRQVGFTELGAPDRWMEINDPEIYNRLKGE